MIPFNGDFPIAVLNKTKKAWAHFLCFHKILWQQHQWLNAIYNNEPLTPAHTFSLCNSRDLENQPGKATQTLGSSSVVAHLSTEHSHVKIAPQFKPLRTILAVDPTQQHASVMFTHTIMVIYWTNINHHRCIVLIVVNARTDIPTDRPIMYLSQVNQNSRIDCLCDDFARWRRATDGGGIFVSPPTLMVWMNVLYVLSEVDTHRTCKCSASLAHACTCECVFSTENSDCTQAVFVMDYNTLTNRCTDNDLDKSLTNGDDRPLVLVRADHSVNVHVLNTAIMTQQHHAATAARNRSVRFYLLGIPFQKVRN